MPKRRTSIPEHVLVGVSEERWEAECTPVIDRLMRHQAEGRLAQNSPGSPRFVVVTDQTLMLDQALVRTQQLERELQDTKREMVRLKAQFAEILELISSSGSAEATSSGATAAFSTDEALEGLVDEVSRSLAEELGDAFAGAEGQRAFDGDLGGEILDLDVHVLCARPAFSDARARVIAVFDRVTAHLDTSRIILRVKRRDPAESARLSSGRLAASR